MSKPIYLHVCFRSGDGASCSIHTHALMRLVDPISLDQLIEFGRQKMQQSVKFEIKGVCIVSMNEISGDLFNMLSGV